VRLGCEIDARCAASGAILITTHCSCKYSVAFSSTATSWCGAVNVSIVRASYYLTCTTSFNARSAPLYVRCNVPPALLHRPQVHNSACTFNPTPIAPDTSSPSVQIQSRRRLAQTHAVNASHIPPKRTGWSALAPKTYRELGPCRARWGIA